MLSISVNSTGIPINRIYIFSSQFLEVRTLFVLILILGITAALFSNFADIFQSRQVSDIAFYFIYLLLTAGLLKVFGNTASVVKEMLNQIITFMQLFIPTYLLAVGTAAGAASAAAYYQLFLMIVYLILIRIAEPATISNIPSVRPPIPGIMETAFFRAEVSSASTTGDNRSVYHQYCHCGVLYKSGDRMSALIELIKRIGIFMIAAQAVLHFTPGQKYEKYIKLIVGMMVLLQFVMPLRSILNGTEIDWNAQMEEMERMLETEGLQHKFSQSVPSLLDFLRSLAPDPLQNHSFDIPRHALFPIHIVWFPSLFACILNGTEIDWNAQMEEMERMLETEGLTDETAGSSSVADAVRLPSPIRFARFIILLSLTMPIRAAPAFKAPDKSRILHIGRMQTNSITIVI